MNDDFLKSRLRRVHRRYQLLALWRALASCWAVAALVCVAVVWTERATGWSSPLALPLLAGLAATAASAVAIRQAGRKPDYRWIAQRIEDKHPELKGLLLTAVQQPSKPGVEADYFQHRLLQEATARSQEQDWRGVVPTVRLVLGHAVHAVALGCFVFALLAVRVALPPTMGEKPAWVGTDGVAITPGDASIERGDSLVVLAKFGKTLPPTVSLVVSETNAAARTIPLVKSLADPVFGGSVTEVANDFTYRLEYRGERSREFKVTVYEHPRLVRSDVDLNFPGYTKLPTKHIEDTRRVSAVEGTKIDLALQLNKPVASARLVARDGKKTAISLTVTAGKAVATLPGFAPEKSQTYDLQLVDADGRTNKLSAPFVIDVQPNRPPELRLASPRGDVRPSALEEVAFEGTVFDDFGSPAYGLAYATAGGEMKFVELGRDTAAKEKRAFSFLLKLEELGAKPDDLISWYVWADDIGPDGKTRRTSGDLFFAEVRPFDEIFRESQAMQSEEEQQQQQQGQGNQARKLTELQKQIISATWRLQRDGATPKYPADAQVVGESQQQALAQAEEAMGEAKAPRDQALWKTAIGEMEQAVEKLKDAAKNPAPLAQALPAEQAAYQALLKLQSKETNVTRRNRQRGQGAGGQQANQRQIDQLDLAQSENRYETQRQAKAPQNKERSEQLQVMNRLQELARRQQDLNERLKDLQASLQEAKTEQEKEDIKRRLKRLQEEQQQMLADVDEVRQRMDRPENQAAMSQEKQQLDQTRDEVQKAAEAAKEGSVAQALASGTRAQRQLQQMRDELRKQNSSQFADDLRDMRQEARDLANQQDQLGQKIDSLGGAPNQRKSLGDPTDRKELLDQLAQQKEKMNKLVERAQQVSEQAENTEPLLSKQLYDSVRKLSSDDAAAIKQAKQELLNSGMMTRDLYDRLQKASENEAGGKALDLTGEMLKENYLPQASQAGQRARGEINELRRGMERAAESVLGDDAEQLKLAQSELDAITDQLQREIAQGQGQQPNGGAPGEAQQPGQNGKAGDRRQAGAQPGEAGDKTQPQAGQTGGEGDQPGQQPGEKGQPGQQPGKGRGLASAGQQGQQNSPGGESGQQPGAAGEQGQGGQPGATANGADANGQPRAGKAGAQRGRGQLAGGANNGARGGVTVDNLLNLSRENQGGRVGGWNGGWIGGPLTGENFGPWIDRLSDVESLLDTPALRDAVAAAREQARLMRRDLKQDLKKPDWAVVQLKVLKPLVEVRSRVAEELARRDSKESLSPIDRDPVPNRFAESVRRYYEELGKDK